ncbi:hypothetical protein KOR42_07170 [Thalassoglobus neptunius]|uniref:DUF1614 domain-containing protein n=1 Tax=Thalassoglobus neptunius TaxID=1938619 RepID=A0A5C5X2S4_9PLAN|nr:DUF1614 domain-containing protein [Thalassoglobus neptunius]TWT57357.1 hypothetical protein KOR42_07170 [Thalassoglobus neptunius]
MPVQFEYRSRTQSPLSTLIGCLPLFLILMLMCLLPSLLFDLVRSILTKLGLSSGVAGLTVLGVFFGSFINVPVYEFRRDDLQPEVRYGPLGQAFERDYQRVFSRTQIAINIGGCLIPVALAIHQAVRVAGFGNSAILATFIVAGLSIGVCYRTARPVEGIGIMMPGLVPPILCVISAWILLPEASPEERTAAAFIGGVAGPVIGADLLHLRDVLKTPVGIMSIGGAGTFDGIVLSGMLAALLS